MISKKKPKGGGKKCLIAAVIVTLLPATVLAAEQCQTFSDGVTICYPVGGSSSFGK